MLICLKIRILKDFFNKMCPQFDANITYAVLNNTTINLPTVSCRRTACFSRTNKLELAVNKFDTVLCNVTVALRRTTCLNISG